MKTCHKCGKSMKKDFDFCPYCGSPLDTNNSWGMLGKNDHMLEQDPFSGSFFGGGILNKMFGNAMKLLENELQKDVKDSQPMIPNTRVQLYINGKRINMKAQPRIIKKSKTKKEIKGVPSVYFSKEAIERFSNLPKESPKTSVRRLSDRIIYDIEMQEVKSMKDVSIVRFENSIEIKAIGKNKAYFKVIQIGLPIIDHYLSEGKLILELGEKD